MILGDEEICPGGDVTLVVGEENRQFIVSSMVLRSTSSVFNKMFGPDFSEGRTLIKTKHVKVPLPEDSPEALLPILFVLHYQNDRVPLRIPPAELYHVALLSDKYDLTVALKFAARRWVDQPCVTDSKELLLLMKSACLFEDSDGFRKVTAALVLHHQGTYAAFVNKERLGPHTDVLLRAYRKPQIFCL